MLAQQNISSGNFFYRKSTTGTTIAAIEVNNALADLGGPARRTPPPQGSRFFHFDIQNFRNVTALGVPMRSTPPPMGTPGSATVMTCIVSKNNGYVPAEGFQILMQHNEINKADPFWIIANRGFTK